MNSACQMMLDDQMKDMMKDMMKKLLYARKEFLGKTVPLDKSIPPPYNLSRRTRISQEHKIQQFPLLVHRVGEVIRVVYRSLISRMK